MAKKKKPERTIVRLKDGSMIELPPEKVETVDFGQQLRDAITREGLTQYHIAKLTGIPQAVLSTFINGKDLRLSTFNKLAHFLGFEMHQNADTSPKRLDDD